MSYNNFIKINFLIGIDYILRVFGSIITCCKRKPYKRYPRFKPRFVNMTNCLNTFKK